MIFFTLYKDVFTFNLQDVKKRKLFHVNWASLCHDFNMLSSIFFDSKLLNFPQSYLKCFAATNDTVNGFDPCRIYGVKMCYEQQQDVNKL